jgi:IS1 family transposase
MSHISSTDTLKSIYFVYFHSIMKYGIIFRGNSPNSKLIFTFQKRTVRIIAGVKSRTSCRNLFMSLESLPLPCEYIFTLMNSDVSNQEHFQTNSAIHSVNIKNRDHLHRPTANLSCFQKSVYYADIKIFNSLSSNLRSLMNKKAQFKVALKRYLNTHSCYSVEEFLMLLIICAKVFSSYCFVVWILHNMCILHIKLFCVIFTVFWKGICLWFHHIVSVLFLFCSFCIYLYVMYLYDLFHILLLPLQT